MAVTTHVVLYRQIFAESELLYAFSALHRKQQFLNSYGQHFFIYIYTFNIHVTQYNPNVSIWLSTSDLFRHLNLYVSFFS